ncbi:MAG: protoporphyrinogen/coproporphyrinogen oxidase [Porticoccaceae bacterium]
MTDDNGVVILGAGMAGFGAAYCLREEGARGRIYEARTSAGGHTSTHFYDDGFVFDEGPHISFTSEKRLQDLFAAGINGKYEVMKAYVDNYWRGHWIKHPAQINLHGLPDETVISCIKDFIAASAIDKPKIGNYEDWLIAAFGKTFAATFPMEYTKKYHTTEAKNLTTDWLGPRLYRPTLDEVLLGAMKPEPLDVHYVDTFRYPTDGGFVAYLKQFEPIAAMHCGYRVHAIHPATKTLSFTNGETATYQQLVSSIPLPRLIPMIQGAPKDVLDAASLLSCSQVVLVNIGLNRPVETRAQWTYFYDDDICFARLSFPPGFSPKLVPAGCGSIQAEVYFSEKWRPLTNKPEDWIEPTIDGLIQCGLVNDRSEVIHKSVIFAPFANVIFDQDRPKALATVHGFLDDIGLSYCGRYGDWGYIWTDQAFMSGERAAKVASSRLHAST